ncbi:hypothetical protein FALBO_1115 [Fusarium albosuccineum]|uniref:2EXR domain-containing protein n=1 Tax=Fusarium albosuccineum TaxID=1237068 RepID=A0A8H4PDV8_9HYPO|nr:hypothetical protein FALBO_1115 [Fusarium albosuccineum]
MPLSDAKDAATAVGFMSFPRLPLELRRQIWRLARLCDSDTHQGVSILSCTPEGKAAPLTVYNSCSSVLGACREARQTALETIPLTRKYNPEADILYVDHDTFYKFCDFCREDDWPAEIRHLALSLPVSERGLWLPIALTHMPKMEAISIVFPKATGEVDCHEHVACPKQRGATLRKFTGDEMDSFKISADYLYETHFGDIPIVWTKSTREYIEFVKGELARGARGYDPVCWDEETKSLRLTFDARCFAKAGEP